jgi:hypothetical protein
VGHRICKQHFDFSLIHLRMHAHTFCPSPFHSTPSVVQFNSVETFSWVRCQRWKTW